MTNRDVASLFEEMADLLDVKGGERYRARAFRRVAYVVENLAEPLEDTFLFGRLERIRGVGEGAVERIVEMLQTGGCVELERLRSSLPAGVRDMARIEGIGPRTARVIFQHLGLGSIDDLERAARVGKLARLPGIGDRNEERILRGIEIFRRNIPRLLLSEAIALGGEIVEALRGHRAVLQADLAGSARRRKETVRDLDVLVISDDEAAVVSRFTSLPGVQELVLRGDTKCSVRLESGHQVDVRIIPQECYGAALHYFTGSQQHNIYLRARGNRRGLKISEKGVFRRQDERRLLSGRTEQEVFGAVGLPYIAPELRENLGEIKAAEQGDLPNLVAEEALRGDLHLRPQARGARPLVEAAARLGHRYVAVCEPAALVGAQLERRARELRKLEDHVGTMRVLAGVEVEILPDGGLSLEPALLARLDWVVATVTTHLEMPAHAMTQRVVRALESGVVDALAHPTGRILNERAARSLDLDAVLRCAARTGVAMELSGDPRRLDLDAVACRRARAVGALVAITADAAVPDELGRLRTFGLYTARRGWLEEKDVLNSRTIDELEERRRSRLKGSAHSVTAPRPGAATARKARETDTLTARLRSGTLDDALLDRLERYLRDGRDEILDAALRRLSDNPLQQAFNLVFAHQAR